MEIKIEWDKVNLTRLVRSSSPAYCAMDIPIIQESGVWVGGFVDEWRWNDSFEKDLSIDDLKAIHLICMYSWKV